MKQTIFFAFILFSILTGCSNTNSTASEPVFEKITENHEAGYVYPDYGVFYKYGVSAYNERISSPVDTLKMLFHQGVKIKNGWYRHYLNGCQRPGSDFTTTTIYPTVFIIQASQEDSLLNEHGFFKMDDQPQPIVCGYNVTRYHLK